MIRLAQFEKKDFPQLIQWIDTEALLLHWSGNLFHFPLTEKKLEWYINDTNEAGQSDAFVYKAVNENNETVGHISLGGISYKNRSARISRVFVDINKKGLGICKEMVMAVLKIGFEDLKLHRISLGVYNDNPSAVRCYEKCGLIIEGISRDIMQYEKSWWSMIEMGILENEWQEINKIK